MDLGWEKDGELIWSTTTDNNTTDACMTCRIREEERKEHKTRD